MHAILPATFAFLFTFSNAGAQRVFAEGTLVYAVTVIVSAPQAQEANANGLYTVTIKGDKVRKTLELNGYAQTMLLVDNHNSAIALQAVKGEKYAIMLDSALIAETIKPFLNLRYKCSDPKETIAGYKAKNCRIVGSGNSVTVSQEAIVFPAMAFERFHDFGALPLAFSYGTDASGILMFTLVSMSEAPVETNLFRVPAGYKTISATEFADLQKH